MMVRIGSLLVVLVVAGSAGAQFTWTSNSNGLWSTPANWLNSSPPPSGGSSTTILEFRFTAPLVAVPATIVTATNDLVGPFQLNALNLSTSFGAYTTASYLGLSLAGNPLQFTGANATIVQSGAAVRLAGPIELGASTTLTGGGAGHLLITGLVSGSGGLVINRTSGFTGLTYTLGNQLGFYGGQTILNGNNTFSGGVTHDGGNLAYSTATNPTPLGSGPIVVNGTATLPATLRSDAFSANPLPNNFTLNGTLYYTGNNSGTFSGNVSGTGDFVTSGLNATFQNSLSLTGRLIADGGPFRSGAGTLILASNATATSVSGIVIGPAPAGGLTLDNASANNANRVSDNLVVQSARAVLTLTGNSTAATTETLGGLAAAGFETISVISGTTTSATLTLSGASPVTRQNAAMLFARGLNLGQLAPAAANAQNILLSTSGGFVADLIGNPASLNSTSALDVPVLPWGLGVLVASGNPTPAAASLLTYHTVNGIRPLAAAQFATSIISGTVSQQNVRLSGSTATSIDSSTTINSLVIANTTGTAGTTGDSTLTVSSNVVLAAVSTGATAALGNVTFPGEAYLTTFGGNGLHLNGTLTAPSLVKAGTGILTLNAPLAVSGPLTIQVGLVSIGSEAVLGTVSELRLNGGGLRTLGGSGSTITLTKPIFVSGLHGQITTGNAGTSTTTNTVIDSVIADMPWTGSGPYLPGQSAGSIQYGGFGTITPTAVNTYGGNTILSASAVVSVAAEANLGTGGQIIMEGAATLQTTASFTMSKNLVLNGGTGDMTVSPDAGTTLTWTGAVHQRSSATQAFTLTKAGGGTLVLANTANTQSGPVRVNAGTLQLTGTLAPLNSIGISGGANDNFGVLVTGGSTLSGTGRTNRAIFVDGASPASMLAPGVGNAGTLTIQGGSVAAGASLRIGITNGSVPGGLKSGASTLGTLPNPTSNTFLSSTAGALTIDPSAIILIDATGVSFTLGLPYSYRVGQAAAGASLTAVSISSQSQFVPVGFEAIDFNLTAQSGSLFLNFTPVSEPEVLTV
jgi:fibronectin-binding autotransporter adhesin